MAQTCQIQNNKRIPSAPDWAFRNAGRLAAAGRRGCCGLTVEHWKRWRRLDRSIRGNGLAGYCGCLTYIFDNTAGSPVLATPISEKGLWTVKTTHRTSIKTSCGARHNKPRPLLPPTEWSWLVNGLIFEIPILGYFGACGYFWAI